MWAYAQAKYSVLPGEFISPSHKFAMASIWVPKIPQFHYGQLGPGLGQPAALEPFEAVALPSKLAQDRDKAPFYSTVPFPHSASHYWPPFPPSCFAGVESFALEGAMLWPCCGAPGALFEQSILKPTMEGIS